MLPGTTICNRSVDALGRGMTLRKGFDHFRSTVYIPPRTPTAGGFGGFSINHQFGNKKAHHNILCLNQSEIYCRISSVLLRMCEIPQSSDQNTLSFTGYLLIRRAIWNKSKSNLLNKKEN
jgi:hypothetical protein